MPRLEQVAHPPGCPLCVLFHPEHVPDVLSISRVRLAIEPKMYAVMSQFELKKIVKATEQSLYVAMTGLDGSHRQVEERNG